MRDLNPAMDNQAVQIGKPEERNYVTSFQIENQGRNSLMQIRQDGCCFYLRPGDAPFNVDCDWPGVIRTNLIITFGEENQQQYAADGTQPATDAAETDRTQADCIFHKATIMETFIIPDYLCHV